ncbi:hypothetical protein AEYBE204_14760 [Asticcacaulis sp. YBE204]|nr:hypothetical protein AEYBE204_14760 [Asticcacaulis sp. YBE204]
MALIAGLAITVLYALYQALLIQATEGRPVWIWSALLIGLAARATYPSLRSVYAKTLSDGPFFELISRPSPRLTWFALRTCLLCAPLVLALGVIQAVLMPRDLFLWVVGAVVSFVAGIAGAMMPGFALPEVSAPASRRFNRLSPLLDRLRHHRLLIPLGLAVVLTPIATRLALANNPEPATGLAIFGIGVIGQALILCPVSVELTRFMRFQPASLTGIMRQVSLVPFGIWLALAIATLLISGLPLTQGAMIVCAVSLITGLMCVWFYLTQFGHEPNPASWVMRLDLAVALLLALMAFPAAMLWLALRLTMLIRRVRRHRWHPTRP